MSLVRRAEDILLGYLVQVLYFGEHSSPLVVSGACLILACIVLSCVRRILEGRTDLGRIPRALFCIDGAEKTERSRLLGSSDSESEGDYQGPLPR